MQKFNEEICVNNSFLIIGENRNNNASLCKEIMKDIDSYGIIVTPYTDNVYKTIVPNIFTHHDYNESILQKVIHRQHMLIKKNKDDPKAYIILDDCFSEYTQVMKDVIINRQSLHIYPLIITTSIILSEPSIYYDYIIIFKNRNDVNELYNICSNYLIIQDFVLYYNSLKDNECLIFYNNNVYKHIVTELTEEALESCEKFNRRFSHMMN